MKKHIALIFFLLIGMFSNAQLDSIVVTSEYVPLIIQSDSTESTNNLLVKIWVNDVNDLGQVIVDVLETTSDTPVMKLRYTYTELVDQSLIVNGLITFDLGSLDTNSSYTIKTSVQNVQFLDLPQIITFQSALN